MNKNDKTIEKKIKLNKNFYIVYGRNSRLKYLIFYIKYYAIVYQKFNYIDIENEKLLNFFVEIMPLKISDFIDK